MQSSWASRIIRNCALSSLLVGTAIFKRTSLRVGRRHCSIRASRSEMAAINKRHRTVCDTAVIGELLSGSPRSRDGAPGVGDNAAADRPAFCESRREKSGRTGDTKAARSRWQMSMPRSNSRASTFPTHGSRDGELVHRRFSRDLTLWTNREPARSPPSLEVTASGVNRRRRVTKVARRFLRRGAVRLTATALAGRKQWSVRRIQS
jgi:hypothetical protein